MKQVLVFLLSTLAVSLGWDAGLRVRFGVGPNHYIKLPMTLSEAKSENWTKEERADKVLPSLVMYCDHSFILCILYDDTEYASGLQIAFPETEFKDAIWDWDIQGYIKWTASNGKSYWTKHQYYVNEAYLARSQTERASRDPSSLLQAGGSVWVSGNRAELFEVTKQPDYLLANGFTKQGCVPGMGHHYYRVNETTKCDSEMFPWFTMYDRSNNLVGTGLKIAGRIDKKDLAKDYYERPPKIAVWTAVPHGPDCVYDTADKPGYISLHIWYVSKPWMNFCWV